MCDVCGGDEASGPGATARVRVRCSLRATRCIAFLLEYGSISEVRVRARLHFRVKVMHG